MHELKTNTSAGSVHSPEYQAIRTRYSSARMTADRNLHNLHNSITHLRNPVIPYTPFIPIFHHPITIFPDAVDLGPRPLIP
jgi:hypothetical protein